MAESRAREEDLQLSQAYERVYESGTLMFGHQHHQKALTSRKLKIRPKVANIAGLQLSDVLAHPVKQACLIEKGLVADGGKVFGKKVHKAARTKYNINQLCGKVSGYGKVFV